MNRKLEISKEHVEGGTSLPYLSSFERLRIWSRTRPPALLFILKFIGVYSLFYILISQGFFREHIHPVISNVYALISSSGLNLFGASTMVINNDMIQSSSFSVNIQQGCDAIEPMGLYVSLVLAYSAIWRNKLKGLIVGISILFIINIIRIVTLFIAGKKSFELFEALHKDIWPFVFILFTIALSLFWIRITENEKIKHQ
jgi:exosortase/archaeosortase family protein